MRRPERHGEDVRAASDRSSGPAPGDREEHRGTARDGGRNDGGRSEDDRPYESRNHRSWGGRIGVGIERLDRSARSAIRSVERRRSVERLIRRRPLLTLVAAFGIGWIIGDRLLRSE